MTPHFGKTLAEHLFDAYLEKHREAEELIKQGESKTLEFKSTLRWNLVEDRKDDKVITHAALKTVAAFLNTEGGDLLLGVADDGSVVGIEVDRFESNDQFHAPPGPGGAKRARGPRRHLHRPENPGDPREGRLPGELPAQPGAGIPQVEGSRKASRRGLLRAPRPEYRRTGAGKRAGVHPDPVSAGGMRAG